MDNTSRTHITPADSRCEKRDSGIAYRFYTTAARGMPCGEVVDRVIPQGGREPCHEHDRGYQLHLVERGAPEVVIGGKRCQLEAGDWVLVPPHIPHGFACPEGDVHWRTLVLGASLRAYLSDAERLAAYFPCDAARREALDRRYGFTPLCEPDADPAPPARIPFVRRGGAAVKQYRFPGVTCRLLYGRWDLGGDSELWELVLQRGFRLRWEEPCEDWSLLAVRAGSARVEIPGQAAFVAAPRDLIRIPPCTPHAVTALEEGTVLQDYNCRAKIMRLVEDLEIVQARRPAALADPQTAHAIRRRHSCPVTGVDQEAL